METPRTSSRMQEALKHKMEAKAMEQKTESHTERVQDVERKFMQRKARKAGKHRGH